MCLLYSFDKRFFIFWNLLRKKNWQTMAFSWENSSRCMSTKEQYSALYACPKRLMITELCYKKNTGYREWHVYFERTVLWNYSRISLSPWLLFNIGRHYVTSRNIQENLFFTGKFAPKKTEKNELLFVTQLLLKWVLIKVH